MEVTEQTQTGESGVSDAVEQESETNAGTLLTSAESADGKPQIEPQEGGSGEAGETGAESQTEGEEGANPNFERDFQKASFNCPND